MSSVHGPEGGPEESGEPGEQGEPGEPNGSAWTEYKECNK